MGGSNRITCRRKRTHKHLHSSQLYHHTANHTREREVEQSAQAFFANAGIRTLAELERERERERERNTANFDSTLLSLPTCSNVATPPAALISRRYMSFSNAIFLRMAGGRKKVETVGHNRFFFVVVTSTHLRHPRARLGSREGV